MLIEELIELANKICKQKAEEQTIELKSAQTGCPKRLYDTLSSFSNQDSGGILVFGIDEDAAFQVVGVFDPQELQKKITEQCLQMEPPVRAVFTLAEYQGKTICAAESRQSTLRSVPATIAVQGVPRVPTFVSEMRICR